MSEHDAGSTTQGQDSQQAAAATSSGTGGQRPRRRRRWLRRVVILVLLLGVFIAMLPVILSTGPGRSVVLGIANMFIPGRISAEQMSLGWGRGQNIKGLRVSNAGEDILVVDEIDMPGVSLWGLIWGSRNFGTITVAMNDATHIKELDDGSLNLMRALTGPPAPPRPEPEPEPFELPRGLNVELRITGAMQLTSRIDGHRRVEFEQFEFDAQRTDRYAMRARGRILVDRPATAVAAATASPSGQLLPAGPGAGALPVSAALRRDEPGAGALPGAVSAELRPHRGLDAFLDDDDPGTFILDAKLSSPSPDTFPTGEFTVGMLGVMVLTGRIDEDELAIDAVDPEALAVTLRRSHIEQINERFAATIDEMLPEDYRPIGIADDYPIELLLETLRIPVREAGLAAAEAVIGLRMRSGEGATGHLRLTGAGRIDGITLKDFNIHLPAAAINGPIAIHVNGLIGNTHPATGEYVERQRQVLVKLTPREDGTVVAGEVDVLDLGLADQVTGFDGLLQRFVGSRPGPFDASLAPDGAFVLRFDVPRVDLAGKLGDPIVLEPGSGGRLAVTEAISEFVARLQPLVQLVPGEAELAIDIGSGGVSVPGGDGLDLAALVVDAEARLGEVALATGGPLMEVLNVLRPLGAGGLGGRTLRAQISPIRVSAQGGKLQYQNFELKVGDLPFRIGGEADLVQERFNLELELTARTLRAIPQLRDAVSDDFRLTLPLTGSFDDPKLDVTRLTRELGRRGFERLLPDIPLPGRPRSQAEDRDEDDDDDDRNGRSEAERILDGVGDLIRGLPRRQQQQD